MVTWHDQFSQAGELIVDGRSGDHGAHDKFRDASLHKGIDTAQDSIRRAPGGVGLEGDAPVLDACNGREVAFGVDPASASRALRDLDRLVSLTPAELTSADGACSPTSRWFGPPAK